MNKLVFKSNFIVFLVIIGCFDCAPINQLVPIDHSKPEYGDVELYVYEYMSIMNNNRYVRVSSYVDKTIYHTSIVVNGFEFDYSDEGAKMVEVGKSTKLKILGKISLGKTDLNTDEILSEYHQLIEHQYTKENYKFMSHNSNHFSDALAKQLISSGIPDVYLKQGETETITMKSLQFLFGPAANWIRSLF